MYYFCIVLVTVDQGWTSYFFFSLTIAQVKLVIHNNIINVSKKITELNLKKA